MSISLNAKALGRALVSARESADLSVSDLAEAISVRDERLIGIEAGKRPCPIDMLMDIARITDVSVEQLLRDTVPHSTLESTLDTLSGMVDDIVSVSRRVMARQNTARTMARETGEVAESLEIQWAGIRQRLGYVSDLLAEAADRELR